MTKATKEFDIGVVEAESVSLVTGAGRPRRTPEIPGGPTNSEIAPAGVAEVTRLYGLRMWVEQSYKQVKQALG